MKKIRKGNVIYRIHEDYVSNFIRRGFEVIEDEETDKPTLETHDMNEILHSKEFKQLTKAELIELAKVRGIELTGDELINDLRVMLR